MNERQERILWQTRRDGRIYTARLAEEYRVSEETVRRDIRLLAKEGKLKRVHGGALCLYPPSVENAYEVRRGIDAPAKRQIGRYAAASVRDGDIIGMDSSCCNEQLALELVGRKDIVVVTNFLVVANVLGDMLRQGHLQGKVILIGGELVSENASFLGTLAEEMLLRFRFTRAFISASALAETGPMVWNMSEGRISALMARQATNVTLLSESAKFNQASMYQYMDYTSIDELITDDAHEIPIATRARLERDGVDVIVLNTNEGAYNE